MPRFIRRALALAASGAIVAMGLVATSVPASASVIGPVDPTILDGAPNSLRDVVDNQVADGDTVELQAGATYVLDDCDGDGYLFSTADITVHGNGATIRQTCDRVVWAPQGNLTIDGVTITGGHDTQADYDGGAFHSDGDSLIIRNSSLINNATCDDGGAITFDSDGTLVVENTTIAGNSARRGGAITSHAESSAVATIVNSTITGNSAAQGGALLMHDGSDLSLTYTTLVGNTVEQHRCSVRRVTSSRRGTPRATTTSLRRQLTPRRMSSFPTRCRRCTPSPRSSPSRRAAPTASCRVRPSPRPPKLFPTRSSAYNFSDDASCGLTATGDRQSAGSPVVGPLAGQRRPDRDSPPAHREPADRRCPARLVSG